MRFVPVKTPDDQAILALHRVRQGFVEERTALVNRTRGLLMEFGIVLPQRIDSIRHEAGQYLETLEGYANRAIGDLLSHLMVLDQRVAEYDKLISDASKQDERILRIMDIPGIGPITATALIAAIGNGHDFKNGRQLSAWLGMVPRQYSSGGKPKLGRITKKGDPYLRTLMILGARSVIQTAKNKTDRFSLWVNQLYQRVGYGKALVAIASKNARAVWAMLSKQQKFNPEAWKNHSVPSSTPSDLNV
jgi:transposase